MRPRRTSSRRGTTLIELTLALAISSVLLLGMASALLIAVRSVPDPASASSVDRTAERAAQRLAEELAEALAVPERTPAALTLVLPDRDGDGVPEAVRWWRDDAPGALLQRGQNQEPAEAVTGPLLAFDAAFSARDAAPTHAGVPVRGNNVELASFESSENDNDFTVGHQRWYAVPLLAELPADAVAWELEDVTFRLQHIHSDGVLRVEIQRWSGDRPSGPSLGFVDLGRDDMPHDDEWVNVDFTSVDGNLRTPRGSHLVALLRNTGGSQDDAADFEGAEVDDNFADGLFESTDRGSSWTRVSEVRARHSFRGRLWTPGPAWSSPRPLLGPVTLRVRASASREATAVALPGGGAWAEGWRRRADFVADPSLTDFDADGAGDFTPALPAGSISNGVFRVPNAAGLRFTGAAAGLPGVTRLRLRLRDRTVGDDGGELQVRFGRGGGTASRLSVRVWREEEAQRIAFDCAGLRRSRGTLVRGRGRGRPLVRGGPRARPPRRAGRGGGGRRVAGHGPCARGFGRGERAGPLLHLRRLGRGVRRHRGVRRGGPVRAARRRAGFSLVEATLSMVLVAVLMVSALSVAGAAATTRGRADDRATAVALAGALLAEALAKPYDDPQLGPARDASNNFSGPAWGPDPGEGGQADRLGYDDPDDFDGWSSQPPREPDGSPVADASGLRRSAVVRRVQTGDPSREVANDEGIRRVVVRVHRGERLLAEAVGLTARTAEGVSP